MQLRYFIANTFYSIVSKSIFSKKINLNMKQILVKSPKFQIRVKVELNKKKNNFFIYLQFEYKKILIKNFNKVFIF